MVPTFELRVSDQSSRTELNANYNDSNNTSETESAYNNKIK